MALEHPALAQFHDPENEYFFTEIIRMELEDPKGLQSGDYKNALYKEVVKIVDNKRESVTTNTLPSNTISETVPSVPSENQFVENKPVNEPKKQLSKQELKKLKKEEELRKKEEKKRLKEEKKRLKQEETRKKKEERERIKKELMEKKRKGKEIQSSIY